jgi:putative ABC transport system substrate-binding protein
MRRTKLAAFVVVAVLCHAAFAQQTTHVQRIGLLGPTSSAPPPAPPPLSQVLRGALAELGLVEGRDIVIDSRWPDADRLDRLPEAAAELVGLKAQVIVAIGATAARAAMAATADIPIVFAVVVDPISTGLTANLERPGGNVTGLTTFDAQHATKQMEILRDAIPGLARVAVLGDAAAAPGLFQAVEDAARTLGLETQTLKVARGPKPDFDGVLAAAKQDGAAAVVVLSTPVTTPHRTQIAESAAKYRLPILSPRDHADAGGLISYGTAFSESTRRAAAYVEKILKGAQAGNLAVETVRRPELIINLKTARQIGITFSPAMLGKATRVIE